MSKIKFYSNLNPTSAKEVERMLRFKPEEQYRINEELALSRLFNIEVINVWNEAKAAHERAIALKDPILIDRTKKFLASAQHALQDEIKNIAILAEKAANVEHRIASRIDENTFLVFVDIVIRLVNEIFYDGTREAEERLNFFEEQLRESLTFKPVDEKSLKPVQENQAMLNSIPIAPPEIDVAAASELIEEQLP